LLGAIGLLQPLVALSQPNTPIVTELLAEWRAVGEKTVALARVFPPNTLDWRPSGGARSVSEVIVHVTGSNYWLAAVAGVPAPAATGLKGDDETTAIAYDARRPPSDSAIAELAASIAHVEKGLLALTPDRFGSVVTFEGRARTILGAWVHTVAHAHEHLGQLIAYARATGIVPPWSR
jgi:uncharacterized damage-inducible protein DinB